MPLTYPPKMQRWHTLDDMLAPERNSFGIIRLAMALCVLVSHCFFLATGSSQQEPLSWTGYTLGDYGVQTFFILSGILVTQSLAKSGDVLDFAIARALRIFPGLIVCVFATALILGPIVSNFDFASYFTSRELPLYLIKTLLLTTGSAPLPQVFSELPAPNLVNLSLWTLKYEVLCYIGLGVIGIVMLALNKRRAFGIAVLAMSLTAIFYKRPELGPDNALVDSIRYFALFFGTGVIAFAARMRLPITGLALPPLFVICVAAAGTRWAELGSAVFLGYGALCIASQKFGALRATTNRYDLSYGTYIYGVPVTQTLLHFWPTMGLPALVGFTTAIVLPLAFVSWTLVESPALRLRKSLRLSYSSWLRGTRDELVA
ncbi:acyltransferase family protein [Hyphomicrobium sp. 2TAF46]|uniref:acyltransferase family protein n=1 Tax=Hyphomicrobium sp. 2TAF46 TaxID=3233019 RepID=UPI003F923C6F